MINILTKTLFKSVFRLPVGQKKNGFYTNLMNNHNKTLN